MKNWKQGLRIWTVLAAVIVLSLPAFCQKETEAIEKYRIVYDYNAPAVPEATDVSNSNATSTRVSPDSLGVFYEYDKGLVKLLDLHKRSNESMVEGPGFRIQIYAGSKMETANEAKTDFLQAFRTANMDVYKDWNPPHFWVRVGDFLSRNEAMKQLPNVRTVFPDAFVVQDKIKLPKYKKSHSPQD